MNTYYNEWDKSKCAWLRELARRKLITPGTIDARDINDVIPAELSAFRRVHLFAGIGGWDYALRLAGWPEELPIWTASLPCQPFSDAGKRTGVADTRHLFPAVHWLISQCRPPIIVGEQVASPAGILWFDTVSARLESEGYAVATFVLPASSVGAPHRRRRQFWLAYSNMSGQCAGSGAISDQWHNVSGLGYGISSGLGGESRRGAGGIPTNTDPWGIENCEWVTCADGKTRCLEPGLMPLAHGVPARVVRISGYGDAIVPQVAAAFLRAVLNTDACVTL